MSKLLDILDKNFPKYDILLKILFFLDNSQLRKILSIPHGTSLNVEFPTFEQTRADALILNDNKIYHIEFQSKNDNMMNIRMLEYRLNIIKFYSKISNNSIVDVVQTVIYVGNENLNMKNYFSQTGIDFEYMLIDIRETPDETAETLLKSSHPLDWILSYLISSPKAEEKWSKLAHRIWTYMRTNGDHAHLPIPAALLVAATLRRIGYNFRKGILNMFSMTIENDPLLKEIYDQGGEYEIRKCLIENIEKGLIFHDITIDSRIEEFIPTADIKIIRSIHDALMLFTNKDDFLQLLEDIMPSDLHGYRI